MPNIYLKITIAEKWPTQNFNLLNFKSSCPGQFCRAPAHAYIVELSNFLLQLKNQSSVSKIVCGVSIIFISKGIMTFESQRVHAFCWIRI